MKKFAEDIRDSLSEIFPECQIGVVDVTKNNGLLLTGITIREKGKDIAPNIYVNGYYKEYVNGKDKADIIKEIAELYEERKQDMPDMDLECLTCFEKAKDRICFKLVNANSNVKRLEKMPHRLVQDWAVIYYIHMGMDGRFCGSITVSDDMINIWKVGEETLYELAMKNTPYLDKGEVLPLTDSMLEIAGEKKTEEKTFEGSLFDITLCPPDDPVKMYVVTSSSRLNGAGVILYPELLETVGEMIGDFFVLPSSVHETILLPFTEDMDRKYLEQMVREVNRTVVMANEILSNHVYYYHVKEKKMQIVAA